MAVERLQHRFYGSTRVSVAYYEERSGTIEVVFVNGVRWEYLRCNKRTWSSFKRTASPGTFVREVLERHSHRAASG